MSIKEFILKNILLISLLGLLVGYSAFLLVSTWCSHLVRIQKQSQWYKKEKIEKALELVGETNLLAEIDMIIQHETNNVIFHAKSCPNMFRFSRQFCAAAKWKECQMPQYGKAIALVRPFRLIDPSDAICFLPSNRIWDSSMVSADSTLITNRIILISNLHLTGCDNSDMDIVILPALGVHRNEFLNEFLGEDLL